MDSQSKFENLSNLAASEPMKALSRDMNIAEENAILNGKAISKAEKQSCLNGISLDLSLSNYNSNVRIDLSRLTDNKKVASDEESPSKDMNNDEKKQEQSKSFQCNFCKREFSTSQALGGHQNAHKTERALAKKGRVHDVDAFGANSRFPIYPYMNFPSMASFGGYLNRSPFSVRANSMIHKPTPLWPAYRFSAHGRGGKRLSPQTNILKASQTSNDDMKIDGSQGSKDMLGLVTPHTMVEKNTSTYSGLLRVAPYGSSSNIGLNSKVDDLFGSSQKDSLDSQSEVNLNLTLGIGR